MNRKVGTISPYYYGTPINELSVRMLDSIRAELTAEGHKLAASMLDESLTCTVFELLDAEQEATPPKPEPKPKRKRKRKPVEPPTFEGSLYKVGQIVDHLPEAPRPTNANLRRLAKQCREANGKPVIVRAETRYGRTRREAQKIQKWAKSIRDAWSDAWTPAGRYNTAIRVLPEPDGTETCVVYAWDTQGKESTR